MYNKLKFSYIILKCFISISDGFHSSGPASSQPKQPTSVRAKTRLPANEEIGRFGSQIGQFSACLRNQRKIIENSALKTNRFQKFQYNDIKFYCNTDYNIGCLNIIVQYE